MTNRCRSFVILVATVWGPIPLVADPYTASVVRIVLSCGESFPKTITVIPNDDEDLPIFQAERIPNSNIWEGMPGLPFDADGRIVSVRFDGGRTGCSKSIRANASRGDYLWLAQFKFKCYPTEVWSSLAIESKAAVPITTVRQIPGSVPCKATSWMKTPGTLAAVAREHEDIYIQFGDSRGVVFQYFDMLIKNGEFGGKPIEGDLPVDRALVVQQLKIRGGRGSDNAATIQNEFNLNKSVKTVNLKRIE